MGAFPFIDELAEGQGVQLATAEGRWVSATGRRIPGTGTALPIAAFVDPQNLSGNANDANLGDTAANPIRTTAENNRRIVAANPLAVPPSLVTYLSDDNSGTATLLPSFDAATALGITGTPVVLATTTVTAVQAIDPATKKAEQVTTLIADLTPFVLTGSFGGGSASFACFFRVKGGPRAGTTAWIDNTTAGEGGTVAKVNCSRPVDATFQAAGSIQVGDTVEICRACNITMAAYGVGANASVLVTLTTLQFLTLWSPDPAASVFESVFNGCTALDSWGASVLANSCFFWKTSLIPVDGITMQAGVYRPGPVDVGPFLVILSDTRISGSQGIIASGANWLSVVIAAGFGAGAQFFVNTTDAVGAQIACFTSQNLGGFDATGNAAPALLWGGPTATSGLLIGPGATVQVSSATGTQPTIAGSAQDIGWLDPSATGVVTVANQAHPVNETTAAYGALASTISFASLFGGTFNNSAHRLGPNAHLVATGATG